MASSRANDFSIGGIFMWVDYFDYQYCIYANTLFIKGVSELDRNTTAFSLPIGAMPLKCAVDLVADYCKVNGIKLKFSAVPDDRLDDLRALGPSKIERLVDWTDYIYDACDLANLSGKRFNKKRNHVNQFTSANPDYRVEALTGESAPEVRCAYVNWLSETDVDKTSAASESLQTLNVLDNLDKWGFEGILLRDQRGEIVAFTLGEVIGDTLFTHIEKMNHSVSGSGEMINRSFARWMIQRYPDLQYINREEDAGDEGLRQAKLSYHPTILLSKYDVTLFDSAHSSDN